jgi:hypothetical protein
MIKSLSAPLAQLDRASVFGTEGWGFDSLMVYSSIGINPRTHVE